MFVTIYARFIDASMAEKAMGALLDHGAQRGDITGFFPEGYQTSDVYEVAPNVVNGITTTTGADAAAGAVTGAEVGLGLGAAAVLGSLLIPGFGLVTGGGALASALIGWAGATAGGAVAGGVAGFLQDQGIDQTTIVDQESALKNGQAILVVKSPSGPLSELEISALMTKYQAQNFGRTETSFVAVNS